MDCLTALNCFSGGHHAAQNAPCGALHARERVGSTGVKAPGLRAYLSLERPSSDKPHQLSILAYILVRQACRSQLQACRSQPKALKVIHTWKGSPTAPGLNSTSTRKRSARCVQGVSGRGAWEKDACSFAPARCVCVRVRVRAHSRVYVRACACACLHVRVCAQFMRNLEPVLLLLQASLHQALALLIPHFIPAIPAAC